MVKPVIGRKRSIKAMVDEAVARIGNIDQTIIVLQNAIAPKDADYMLQYLKDKAKEKMQIFSSTLGITVGGPIQAPVRWELVSLNIDRWKTPRPRLVRGGLFNWRHVLLIRGYKCLSTPIKARWRGGRTSKKNHFVPPPRCPFYPSPFYKAFGVSRMNPVWGGK